jgi:16S rRNA processing protein RimM|tara:strand:+ start:7789 stop:8301 length:513 start_codon:yes stop_codon:yes gene_type:complete
MPELELEHVVVGKFGRPQGIKGLVRVTSFTEPRENVLDYPHWFMQVRGVWHEIKHTHDSIMPQHLVTRIDGYTTREQVAELTNAPIAVSKKALPPLKSGEFYWHQLVGMQVVHEQGLVLGTVESLFATGSNDVLVVVGEKRRLIPYLMDDVIQTINTDSGIITVCWDVDF